MEGRTRPSQTLPPAHLFFSSTVFCVTAPPGSPTCPISLFHLYCPTPGMMCGLATAEARCVAWQQQRQHLLKGSHHTQALSAGVLGVEVCCYIGCFIIRSICGGISPHPTPHNRLSVFLATVSTAKCIHYVALVYLLEF